MDARDRALKYLNVKPRTRYQLTKYLTDKGYDEIAVTEAVKEMEEYHFIDDYNYAQMYFEYGYDKGRGTDRIKRELREKGVDTSVIEAAFEDLEEIPDQLDMALEIGRNVVAGIDPASLDYKEREKLKAKLGRRLVSRGFTMDIAYKIIDQLIYKEK